MNYLGGCVRCGSIGGPIDEPASRTGSGSSPAASGIGRRSGGLFVLLDDIVERHIESRRHGWLMILRFDRERGGRDWERIEGREGGRLGFVKEREKIMRDGGKVLLEETYLHCLE